MASDMTDQLGKDDLSEQDSTAIVEVIRGLGLGGSETLLYCRLAEIAARRNGHLGRYTVISTAPHQQHFEQMIRETGCHVISTTSASPFKGGLQLIRLLRRNHKGSTIVVHSPSPAIFIKCSKALGILSNVVIEVVHSSNYRLIYKLTSAITNRMANAGIAVSQAVATSAGTMGLRPLSIIYGGVGVRDMRSFLEQHPDLRRTLWKRADIPSDATVICAVGSLIPLKGHVDLLEAFSRLPRGPHLVLVGEGPERKSLESVIGRLNIGDRVHLVGSYWPAWHWISASHILCHPSHHEGLPVAMIEAFALGKQVIATDFPAAQEALALEPALVKLAPIGDVSGIEAQLRTTLSQDPGLQLDAQASSYNWSIDRYVDEFLAALESARTQSQGRSHGFKRIKQTE